MHLFNINKSNCSRAQAGNEYFRVVEVQILIFRYNSRVVHKLKIIHFAKVRGNV